MINLPLFYPPKSMKFQVNMNFVTLKKVTKHCTHFQHHNKFGERSVFDCRDDRGFAPRFADNVAVLRAPKAKGSAERTLRGKKGTVLLTSHQSESRRSYTKIAGFPLLCDIEK